MPHAYVNLPDMKAALGIDSTDTADDTRLRAVLEGTARAIDRRTGRRFQPYTGTRYYTADGWDRLPVDDLLAVTTIKTLTTNSNGTRTYGDTWATTDYDLSPSDAPDDSEPYTVIRRNPSGLYSFPTDELGIEIAGIWGYWRDLLNTTTLGAAIVSTTATSITISDSSALKALQTILIDSEQLYVTAVNGTTATVERGVNGTTAATHSNGAAVAVYRYPPDVVEAALIQGSRLFRRKDAPFGVAGSPEMGLLQNIPSIDPDVRQLLWPVQRIRGAAI